MNKKMEIGEHVYVMMIENSLTTNYLGILDSIALQTIPALNIEKGDYWVRVENLNKIILCKKKGLMEYDDKPMFILSRGKNNG